jgi:hypothetical protein
MLPNALKMFMALGNGAACRPYTEPRRLCAAAASSSHRQCIEWLDMVKQQEGEQQHGVMCLCVIGSSSSSREQQRVNRQCRDCMALIATS